MTRTSLPDAVVNAIARGDITRLKDLYQPDMTLEDIAMRAAADGQPEIMHWCCDQGWRPPRESFNSEFYSTAVHGASPAVFQILIDHGLDLNENTDERVGDALAITVRAGHYDFAKWLLEHGHRPTADEGYYGSSTIIWTVADDTADFGMLKLLIDYGYDLEECGAGVQAANEGNVKALRLLLDRGIDIEDTTMDHYPFQVYGDPESSRGTALYRACRMGHTECVKLLLERGADPLAKDLAGISCLAIAKQRGYYEILQLLKESGAVDQSVSEFVQWLFSFFSRR